MMDIPLRPLRYFLAAAEHGSVTAAARALNVSQPSVSLAIGQLEEILGVQLFVRQHSRGVALTPSGLEIVRQARKFLAQADDFMASIASIGGGPHGTLSVGCFSNLVPRFLGALLHSFSSRHPGIQIVILEGDHEQLVKWMRNGEIELALTYDQLLDDRFAMEALVELAPHVLVPARHRLALRSAIHLSELINDPCILLDLPVSQEYLALVFGSLGLRPNVKYKTRSIEAVRSLVGNELGYSVLSQVAETSFTYDGKEVRALPLKDTLPLARVVLVHLTSVKPRLIGDIFRDFCREYFAQFKASL